MANRTWSKLITSELIEVTENGNIEHCIDNCIDPGVQFVLLYFSAHWCGPCRQFTPALSAWYNTVNEDSKKVEIIYVSSDQTNDEFLEYAATMPWKCIPFSDVDCIETRNRLKSMCQVQGIPKLVVLDVGTKDIVTDSGREDITNCMGPPSDVLDLWLD